MNLKLLTSILFLIITGIQLLFGQERMGIVNSNYAGSNGTMINPSSIVKTRFDAEITLLTIGTFIDNNYVYVQKTNLFGVLGLMKTVGGPMIYNEKNVIWDAETSTFNIKDVYDKKDKTAYMDLLLRGPSFMISKDKDSFGFHNALRLGMSLRNVPYDFAKFGFEGVGYTPQWDTWREVPDLRFNLMSWSELGFSYGRVLYEDRDYRLNAGLTFKFLYGYLSGFVLSEGLYYYITTDTVKPNTFKWVDTSTASYGYTDPFSFQRGNLKKGKGKGLDLGITYSKITGPDNYKWKIGISLLDFGKIKFVTNAKELRIDYGSAFFHRGDSLNWNTVADLDTFVSRKFYQDYYYTEEDNKYRMKLPLAASLQFDYQLTDRIYINSTVIQRLHSKKPLYRLTPGVDRSNIFTITPRFESKQFELHFPFVLYEYREPRLGVATRIAFLVIGTDKLSSLFLKRDFSGYDFYMSIKFLINKNKKTGGKANKPGKGPTGSQQLFRKLGIGCYDF